MTARKASADKCPDCGSDDLWSNFVDAEGLAIENSVDQPDPDARWATHCNRCGAEV